MDVIDTQQIIKLIAAFAFVLALMGGLSILIRRLGLNDGGGGIGTKKRLALVDRLILDNKRRAVILRCDDEEHLVILGQNSETLIKTLDASQPDNAHDSNTTQKKKDTAKRKPPVL